MIVINGAVSARINGASPTSGTDTSDADMTAADLLAPKVGYGPNGKLTGEMPDNADNDVEVSDLDGTTIPAGYYNGSGVAKLSAAEAAKVVAGNIKKDTVILGVTGTYDNAPTLTGDATEADVAAGKTFYSNDPAIKRTGTMNRYARAAIPVALTVPDAPTVSVTAEIHA